MKVPQTCEHANLLGEECLQCDAEWERQAVRNIMQRDGLTEDAALRRYRSHQT